jgi:hypothetical protein
MTPLETRKKLLIAESEFNRAALVGEAAELSADICAFTNRARSFGTLTSTAAILTTFLGGQLAGPGTKPSWWQTALKGAGLISNLWLVFRPKPHARDKN